MSLAIHEQSGKKIALVVTYFGKLPFWFSAFQLSCRHNPEIQWVIFSDTPQPLGCPDNLTFIYFSIDDFCTLASQKLGITIELSKDFLYKICDFKPAFGLIYEDYLSGYDFWGHCDLDVVWGKVSNHITEEILKEYDIITSRIHRISGHFCLYRNSVEINTVFFEMAGVLKSLRKTKSCERLDEEYFTIHLYSLISQNFFRRTLNKIIGKKNPVKVFWDKVLTTSGTNQRSVISSNEGCYKWKKGKVYNTDGTEFMYLHFHIFKTLPTFTSCDVSLGNKSIHVSPSGIQGIN